MASAYVKMPKTEGKSNGNEKAPGHSGGLIV
jgi:hypothetical protein